MTRQTRWQGGGVPFESVQDALVRARLEVLQAGFRGVVEPERAAIHGAAEPEATGAGVGPTRVGVATRRAGLRVRLGHRLVAIGAALAGEDERAHAHHPI